MVSLWNATERTGRAASPCSRGSSAVGQQGEDPSALFCAGTALGRGSLYSWGPRHSAPLSAQGTSRPRIPSALGLQTRLPRVLSCVIQKGRRRWWIDRLWFWSPPQGGHLDGPFALWKDICIQSILGSDPPKPARAGAQARTQVPQRRFSVPRSDRPLVLGGMLTWAPRLSQFAGVQGPTRCVPCLQRKHPLWSPPAHLPQVRALRIPSARSLSSLSQARWLLNCGCHLEAGWGCSLQILGSL